MEKVQTYPERHMFMDNLRYLMIVFVVVFHAAIAYCNLVPYWSVIDSSKSKLFDILILFFDNFQMPVLFFISGYFVLPVIRKQGSTAFVISKLKKLGIPLILIGLFYTPIIPYIRHVVKTLEPLSYFSYWTLQMKSLSDFSFVYFSDIATGKAYADFFYQHHLWFISLLLVFFLIAAFSYQIQQHFFPTELKTNSSHQPTVIPQNRGKILAMLCVFAIIISCLAAVSGLFFLDWAWARVGWMLLIQPARLPIYAGVFVMGIYAYEHGWLLKPLPGKFWIWIIPVSLLSFILMVCQVMMGLDIKAIHPGLSIATAVIRVFLVLSCICAFMNFGKTRWNSRGPISEQLTRCSYEIYLIHLPIVILLQYSIMSINASAFVKFGIVASLSLFITITLARLIVTPFPRWSVVGLVTGFMVATVFIG